MVGACADGMASSATQLTYTVSLEPGQYLDLAGLLSDHNHRLYRQGMVYHARISATNNSVAGAAMNVEVLQNNWKIRKAWAVAKQSWWASTQDERDRGVRPGRWNDFKIFYEALHTAANTVGPTTSVSGEWNYTIANAATTSSQWQFHMLGSGSTGTPGRFGILREYDDMVDTDQDTPPAAGTLVPFSALQAEVSNNQADLIQEEGDLPPYSAVDLEHAGNETTYFLTSPLTLGGVPVISTGLIQIPCGLVKVPSTVTGGTYRIDFKPGKYKGVHAEAMA